MIITFVNFKTILLTVGKYWSYKCQSINLINLIVYIYWISFQNNIVNHLNMYELFENN